MTKNEFVSDVRAADQRMMRRLYVAVAIIITLMLPLILMVITDSITTRTFQIGLCVYSFVSATVAIFVLQRSGSREVLCPKCEKALWREPVVHQIFASGRCAYCGHNLFTDEYVV